MPDLLVRIRPFDRTDRDFVMSLAPRLVIGIPTWRDRDKMLAAAQSWLTDSIDQHGRNAFVFIAENAQGEGLGVATVSHSSHFTGIPQAELGELAVSEAAEGQGVGRALVAACTQWAQTQGYSFLALSTGAANSRARHFYQRLGFLEEDVRLVKSLSAGP